MKSSSDVAYGWERLSAFVVDTLVFLPFTFLLYRVSGFRFAKWLYGQDQVIPGWITALAFLLSLAFQLGFLKWKAATPGKMLFKLKVVPARSPQAPLGTFQILLRAGTHWLASAIVPLLTVAVYFYRTDRRQIADLAASTQVVRATPRKALPKKRVFAAAVFGLLSLVSLGAATYRSGDFLRQGIVVPGFTPSGGEGQEEIKRELEAEQKRMEAYQLRPFKDQHMSSEEFQACQELHGDTVRERFPSIDLIQFCRCMNTQEKSVDESGDVDLHESMARTVMQTRTFMGLCACATGSQRDLNGAPCNP